MDGLPMRKNVTKNVFQCGMAPFYAYETNYLQFVKEWFNICNEWAFDTEMFGGTQKLQNFRYTLFISMRWNGWVKWFFFLLFLVLSVFLFQNPIASTSPEQSVAPLKKKKFRIGTSLCETALIISWAKTPPRTAADGLISPNVTLKEYSISSERCNEIIWYINNIQEAQLTWMKHSLLPGYRFSFRVKYDL